MKRCIIAIGIGFSFSCLCSAQSTTPPGSGAYVQFNIYSTTGQPVSAATRYQVSGSSSSINLSTTQQHIVVTTHLNGGSTQPVIGNIFVSGGPASGTAPIQVYFAPAVPSFDFPQIPTGPTFGDVSPSPIGSSFGGFGRSTTRPVAFYGGVNGALTGSITVDQLAYFSAGGAIGASITSSGTFSSNFAFYRRKLDYFKYYDFKRNHRSRTSFW